MWEVGKKRKFHIKCFPFSPSLYFWVDTAYPPELKLFCVEHIHPTLIFLYLWLWGDIGDVPDTCLDSGGKTLMGLIRINLISSKC